MLSGARTCARVTDLNLEFQFVMLPADFTAATAAVAAGVAVPAAAAAAAIVTVNPSAAAVPPQPFCCSFVLSISTCSTICLLLSLIFIFLSHSLAKAPSALQPSVFIHQIYIYTIYTYVCVCVYADAARSGGPCALRKFVPFASRLFRFGCIQKTQATNLTSLSAMSNGSLHFSLLFYRLAASVFFMRWAYG